jgi:hypothetical protein
MYFLSDQALRITLCLEWRNIRIEGVVLSLREAREIHIIVSTGNVYANSMLACKLVMETFRPWSWRTFKPAIKCTTGFVLTKTK